MSKPKTRIRITGTRTGKLRARVDEEGRRRFEITLGGEKWEGLSAEMWEGLSIELRKLILERAAAYVERLKKELKKVTSPASTPSDSVDQPMGGGECSMEITNTNGVTVLKDIPDHGDLMTLEKFQNHLMTQEIGPTDGHGYYATEEQVTNIPVSFYPECDPPEVRGINLTHVVWFNK